MGTPPQVAPSPLNPRFHCSQVPKLFPKYIRAPNGPEANPVKQLLPGAFFFFPLYALRGGGLSHHTVP